MAVLACLCLNAVLLFGRDEEAFGNLFRSFHSAFRMMFGDWDWMPMERVTRTGAYLWFTMFMVLVVIILLNMLLAIILDNYMDVKRVSASADSLGAQIQEMYRRRKMLKRKERVRLNDIWDSFVAEAGGRPKLALATDRQITAEMLQQIVPGIPHPQASRTLQNSWLAHLKATTAPFELKHSSRHLSRFEVETRKVRNGLFFLFDRLDFYDTRQDSESPEKERERTDGWTSPNSPIPSSSVPQPSAIRKSVEPPDHEIWTSQLLGKRTTWSKMCANSVERCVPAMPMNPGSERSASKPKEAPGVTHSSHQSSASKSTRRPSYVLNFFLIAPCRVIALGMPGLILGSGKGHREMFGGTRMIGEQWAK